MAIASLFQYKMSLKDRPVLTRNESVVLYTPVHDEDMKIIMNTHFIKTIDDVKTLLSQGACLEPGWNSRDECYQWIEQTSVTLNGDVSKLLIMVSGDKLPDNLIMNVY